MDIFSFGVFYFVVGTSRCAGIQEDDHTLPGKKSGRKILNFHDENPFSKFEIEKFWENVRTKKFTNASLRGLAAQRVSANSS